MICTLPESAGLERVALELVLVLGHALQSVGAAAPAGARHHAAAEVAHLRRTSQLVRRGLNLISQPLVKLCAPGFGEEGSCSSLTVLPIPTCLGPS